VVAQHFSAASKQKQQQSRCQSHPFFNRNPSQLLLMGTSGWARHACCMQIPPFSHTTSAIRQLPQATLASLRWVALQHHAMCHTDDACTVHVSCQLYVNTHPHLSWWLHGSHEGHRVGTPTPHSRSC
jgi:hypothetical protein